MGTRPRLPHRTSLADSGATSGLEFPIYQWVKPNARVACWDLHAFYETRVRFPSPAPILILAKKIKIICKIQDFKKAK